MRGLMFAPLAFALVLPELRKPSFRQRRALQIPMPEIVARAEPTD
jgi:hypothetical protein